MPSLKEVRNRIQSVTSTQQITKAMKMVAAAKLRRAQDRITQMRPFAQKMNAIMRNISSSIDPAQVENPYSEAREVHRVLLIVVASDRGLCGAFNSNVFKFTQNIIAEKYRDVEGGGGLYIMTIGKRSKEYFSKRGYQVIDDFTDMFHHLDFDHLQEAAKHAMEGFIHEDYDQIEIVYNEFKNVATQILRDEQFLPILPPEQGEETADEVDYIFEPDQDTIFNEIIPKSLRVHLYKALLESNAAEHGARMTAMDQATDNANELLKDLRLTFNRTRQAAITKEILEIVGGAEALSQGS